MAVLAKYHLHLDIDLNNDEIEDSKINLDNLVKNCSSSVFEENIVVHTGYKPGSAHFYIEVIGSLFTGMTAYITLRSFIDYTMKDSQTLRDLIKSKLLKHGLAEDKLVQFRKLEGSSDRIRKLIVQLDRFQLEFSTYSYQELSNELVNISKKLDLLAYELDGNDFAIVIDHLRKRNIPQLNEMYRDVQLDENFGKQEQVYFPFK